jgi:hypothetical protein
MKLTGKMGRKGWSSGEDTGNYKKYFKNYK